MKFMSMDMVIRKAELADAAAMADIHRCSWLAAYTGLIPDEIIAAKNAGRPAMWTRVLSGPHGNYLALVDGEPAGLLGLFSPCRDQDLSEAGEIGGLYLYPRYWGCGAGRRMMDFALATLAANGHAVFSLWVLEGNVRARRFYEKCGFAFDGARKEMADDASLMEVRYRNTESMV